MSIKPTFIITLLIASFVFGGENPQYFTTFNNTEIGGYVALGGRASSLSGDRAGWLDGRAVVVLNGKWGIGIAGSALNYDYTLDKLVNDGTYRLEAGYAGLYVERIFSVNEDFKITIAVTSGYGTALYRYDKEYRKEKKWSEEIIDQVQFHVFEPAIEIDYRITGNVWVALNGSIRNTSPLELLGSTNKMLQKPGIGLSFKYGIF
ncbi:MAG: hypothetical protein H6627_00735 [Calditrichae bacterium]|nr:hypothetical protein [Calditrichota bacterium]MCB9057062.1 hypothetical protein [Calditrichia bacterium]